MATTRGEDAALTLVSIRANTAASQPLDADTTRDASGASDASAQKGAKGDVCPDHDGANCHEKNTMWLTLMCLSLSVMRSM